METTRNSLHAIVLGNASIGSVGLILYFFGDIGELGTSVAPMNFEPLADFEKNNLFKRTTTGREFASSVMNINEISHVIMFL